MVTKKISGMPLLCCDKVLIMNKVQIVTRIPAELMEHVKTVAKKTGCSTAQAVREIIAFHKQIHEGRGDGK